MAFWADKIVEKIKGDLKGRIDSGTPPRGSARREPLVIRDEKTASGRIHVGSMRGVAIHGVLSEILSEQKIANTFLYEINDFDPMDGLPAYLDEKEFGQHMGKPLYTIPSPDGKAKNYAEYFAQEFTDVIKESGFHPDYYRASELYKSGKMNEVIRIALEKADTIRTIYKKVSGSVKSHDWLPLSVVCEKCGKIGTTQATSFDGEKVAYSCEQKMVEWAEGCGHSGSISPFDGNAKLPWKVEWAAKFKVLGVDIEGAGKDHSTKGGARDIANHIAREVYDYKPPFDVPYEFFLVGGKKMSSSKGEGSSAREIANLIPPHIFRLALLGKDPRQTMDFIPDGETIPMLYDRYDKIAEKFWSGENDDDARLFTLVHGGKPSLQHFLPRFSIISFIVQMPHMNMETEVLKMKGASLTDEDNKELKSRAKYAKRWLQTYAPEDYKYELQMLAVPEAAQALGSKQKEALKEVLVYVASQKKLDGQELHTKLHEIRKSSGIDPKEFFSALYLAFLGKDSGPKAGWFLSVLDKEFLEKRLGEVTQ